MSRVVPRAVARRVQARAMFMCEYCKLPEALGFAAFEVDHIVAKAYLGSSDYDNLAWSCVLCNLNKGPNLTSVDPVSGKVTKLYHPRKNRWSRHFRLSEGLIVPKTSAGRATISLLKMNLAQTFALRGDGAD